MIKFKAVNNLLKKIAKFGFYVPVSNVILNHAGAILGKNAKALIFNKRNREIQSILWPIIDEVNKCVTQESSAITTGNGGCIWICWFQGEMEMPEIVKLCVASIRANAGSHNVIILTEENYSKYVKIPKIVEERYSRGKLSRTHLSDILRVNILAQRGGLWLDATMFVSGRIPEYIFSDPFYTIKIPETGYYVSKCRWSVFLLSAHAGHPLFVMLSKAFEKYLERYDVFIDYFMFDQFIDVLYKTNAVIRKAIDNVRENNFNVHRLVDMLPEKYNHAIFSKLMDSTIFFKLSTRIYSSRQLDNMSNDTVYKVLESKYL